MADLHRPDPLYRVIDLDEHATRVIYLESPGRRRPLYGLIHRSGALIMHDSTTPETAGSWPDAVLMSERFGEFMIVLFHEKTIRHRRLMPSGGYTWGDVVVFPHKSARTFPSLMPATEKEPDEYGNSKTAIRKQAERAREQRNADRKLRRFAKADREQFGPEEPPEPVDE